MVSRKRDILPLDTEVPPQTGFVTTEPTGEEQLRQVYRRTDANGRAVTTNRLYIQNENRHRIRWRFCYSLLMTRAPWNSTWSGSISQLAWVMASSFLASFSCR